mgnify:CR=1 FL=1
MRDDQEWREWQAWMQEQQRRTNLMLALSTFMLAIGSTLHVLKVYEIEIHPIILVSLVGIIVVCFGLVLMIMFAKQDN